MNPEVRRETHPHEETPPLHPRVKTQLVLEVLTGAQSPDEVSRRHALGPNVLTTWKATVLQRLHTLFQSDEQHDEDKARIAELEQLLGRATRQIEILLTSAWPTEPKAGS